MPSNRKNLTDREGKAPVVPAVLGVAIGVVSGALGMNWKQTFALVTGGFIAWKAAQHVPPDWYGGD